MAKKPFEFVRTPQGEECRIGLRGRDVLSNPMINFGTAFAPEERRKLGLEGLLPSRVLPLEAQVKRVYEQYSAQPDPLSKYVYLNTLHDRNEILFYRVLTEHIEEMLPVVYTPTIGEAIQVYSHWFHRPRGIFLRIDNLEGIEEALAAYGHASDEVDLIVATDSEGILGIGDQGVGGVSIAVGKLAVYTAAAGVHPHRVLPVVLDVGTDNLKLLNDEAYLGVRHTRIRGKQYDEFIDAYVKAATKLFPHALLHWEDFGASNAHRVLEMYRDKVCTFNDDIQGTAAVVVAAVLSAIGASGTKLSDQKIVIHGAGTAGVGIADLLVQIMMSQGVSEAEARSKFYCLGSRGLLREGIKMRDFQEPYAAKKADLASWKLDTPGAVELADVIRNVQPTMLIGTSAQPGCFTEAVVREMAKHIERPIIMPLSNPTSLSEALPEDLLEWTDGRALIATGSPFDPVVRKEATYYIAQANNALVFPGIGLGVSVCRASRVSDGMIAAAAKAVADSLGVLQLGDSILPSISELREVSQKVAMAVIEAAQKEGLATVELTNPLQTVYENMWRPEYPKVVVV
ncbi:MAG: NAD-dependent malic enzyme [Propionibacteriaceae bacterium]